MNKKKLITAIVLILMLCFCFCSCGNSLSGTWYKVCADPENAYDNITFKSDGTFMSDVTGEYVVDGKNVRLNFLGLTTVDYEIIDYNGTDALLEKGRDVPEWCKTVEAAQEAYNDSQTTQ